MKGKAPTLVFALGALIGAIPLARTVSAHHGGGSLYDMSKEITVQATVTEFLWTNPHVQIGLDAKDDKGKVKHWLLETGSPPVLVSRGWNRKSLEAGDKVTITFSPSQRGTNVGLFIKLVKADGTHLEDRRQF